MDCANAAADEANAEQHQQQQPREEKVKKEITIPSAVTKRMIKANCGKLRVSQGAVYSIQMNATNLVKIITREAALKAIREKEKVMSQAHVKSAISRHKDAAIPQHMPIPDRDPEDSLNGRMNINWILFFAGERFIRE